MRIAASDVTPQQIATMFPPVRRAFTTHDARVMEDFRKSYARRSPLTALAGLGAAPAPMNAKLIARYLGWAAIGIGGVVVLSTGFMVYRSFKK